MPNVKAVKQCVAKNMSNEDDIIKVEKNGGNSFVELSIVRLEGLTYCTCCNTNYAALAKYVSRLLHYKQVTPIES